MIGKNSCAQRESYLKIGQRSASTNQIDPEHFEDRMTKDIALKTPFELLRVQVTRCQCLGNMGFARTQFREWMTKDGDTTR